jgi:hypothetical protein
VGDIPLACEQQQSTPEQFMQHILHVKQLSGFGTAIDRNNVKMKPSRIFFGDQYEM